MKRKTTSFLNGVLLAALLLLSACGEIEIGKTDDGGKDDPTRRELQLSFLNKLTLNGKGANTRAAIATNDEQRIDMLDVYVFGSLTEDGEYTFQEKFSYRADGSSVAGTTALEVTNGDGTSAKPTVLLRPKKGLYIKMFCIANQPELSILDNTDAANPKYVSYTNFVPLVQTNPGGDNNSVTMGIPTEADFCKLLSRIIDPANKADSIVPALPMVGSCVAPIDLHSFDMASRLSAGMRLVRTVARFDVLNNAATSRFTLESVSMGNGRPVTQLYPLQEQKTADDKLITYPVRDLARMPQVNNNKQLPVFYAYGSPVEDEAYLILKGKYRMNATEVQEVSYNVPFSQVVNGTGSRVAITPNHRYTIAITKADDQHVDFDFTVADWDNGSDLGSFTPDNAFGTISVEPAAQYDVNSKTMKTSLAPGSEFTVAVGNNMTPEVSLSYDEGGNDWLEATVATTPATRAEWGQTTTCTVKVKDGSFTAYPAATLKLTNSVDGSHSEIRIYGLVELGDVTAKAGNTNNVTYNANTKTLRFMGLNQEQVASVVVKAPGAVTITKPDWLTVTGAPNTGYTFAFSGSATDYTTTPAVVTFANATDATQKVNVNVELTSTAIMVGGVKWAKGNLRYLGGGKYAQTKLPNDPAATVKEVRGDLFRWCYTLPQSASNTSQDYPTTTWTVTNPNWIGESNLGNYSYFKGIIGDTYTKAPSSNPTATETGDPCKGLGANWRMPTQNELMLLVYTPGSTTLSGSNTLTTARNYLKNNLTSEANSNIWDDTSTDATKKQRGIYITKSALRDNPSAPSSYSAYDASQHLFLPAAGYFWGGNVNNLGYTGRCWSSTPLSGSNNDSWSAVCNGDSGSFVLSNFQRHTGLPVRCVSE